jgi:hypothetical protein
METIGYLEKFYIYKVASLPLEVTLRHWTFQNIDLYDMHPVVYSALKNMI